MPRQTVLCGVVSRDFSRETDSRLGFVPDPSGVVRFEPHPYRRGDWLYLMRLNSHPMRSSFSPYAVSILTLWGPILISCAHPQLRMLCRHRNASLRAPASAP